MERKKAHFIGICGAGMSAVAKLLIEKGWEVSGSDYGFYPPISTYLEDQHIPYTPEYSAQNIPKDADIIVIGKHAKLAPEENEEVRAAFASGIPIKSYPEVLGDLARGTENFVVAGSYGKSTCAALLTWCLISAGKDPSFFIGAIPRTPKMSSHLGASSVFILEGDEYPASNWDIRAKFLHYHARHVLLTSLAQDHFNVFPTLESYINPYRELVASLPENGTLTACLDGENVADFLKGVDVPITTYSIHKEADWGLRDVQWGERTTFTLLHGGEPVIELATTLLGEHNILNILGVCALLLSHNLISPQELKRAIESFESLNRRLDLKSNKTTVRVYDGFGSSHEKARSAIAAIRRHFPDHRLLVVFEPYTFSLRNRESLSGYDTTFKGADQVLIYKPGSHGASTHEQLSLNEIVERVRASGIQAMGFDSPSAGKTLIEDTLQSNDIVLILGAGVLDGLLDEIPLLAERKFPR